MVTMVAPASYADVVYAWGESGGGLILGDGTTSSRSVPVPVTSLLSGVTNISTGPAHSLAIVNGGVKAWGYNGDGELGNGTRSDSSIAVAVTGLSSGITAIAAGQYHSLAVQNGRVLAWGYNVAGQLGNNTTTSSRTPVQVTGLTSGVTSISAGTYYCLAIQNGGVWAWGANSNGKLGDGTTAAQRNVPVAVAGLASGVTAIKAGYGHSLAIENGALYAWGTNSRGELGDGTTIDRRTPVAVTGLTSGVTAIASGFDYSLAVKDGGVWVWGYNVSGTLGLGTTSPQYIPKQVDSADLTNIVDVAVGQYCSYALSSDGTIWDWGYNGFGQLGLGDSPSQLAPQHLLPPEGYIFTSLDASPTGYHAVATLRATPEPASLSLIALVAGSLLFRKRRRLA